MSQHEARRDIRKAGERRIGSSICGCATGGVLGLLVSPDLVEILHATAALDRGLESTFDLTALELIPIDRLEKRVALDLLDAGRTRAQAFGGVPVEEALG